ncbi:MAG TPA: 16S rRNA (cytosine(1402)-N(4))-methyltransferase RsmH [Candidatus Saccharimonadales bacterium]|nr:16S rRNA (cytosine(1402)-N(4))-methyltransferase RsmH [Candidatus Saccharimonadales bacterium]
MPNHYTTHLPVLIREVTDCLAPEEGQTYLDLTAGYGGHAETILGVTKNPCGAVLVDRDDNAISVLSRKFGGSGAQIVHSEFLSTLETLVSENRRFDMVLADLGVSSPHLEDSERGFSFSRPGPLDMRMDRRQTLDADSLVNTYGQAELAAIIRSYGEEPKADSIAGAIIRARPVKDTAQLATVISRAAGFKARHGRIHPATRTFQALRIAVNDELGQLEKGLPLMSRLLEPGGRLAIISFHSLEDRLVKRFFAEHAGNTYDAELTLLTKKPITASREEIVSNPRARSAKLRACRKNKNQKER